MLVGSKFVLPISAYPTDFTASDTPWDEPTANSPEFVSYARGEIFQYDPWSRIEPDALGEWGLLNCGLILITLDSFPAKYFDYYAQEEGDNTSDQGSSLV